MELVYTLSDVLKADGTAGTDGVNDTPTAKAGSTTVFVLTVKGGGSWSFDLQDQLDHVVGGNDENFALQVAGGSPSLRSTSPSCWTGTATYGDGLEAITSGAFTHRGAGRHPGSRLRREDFVERHRRGRRHA